MQKIEKETYGPNIHPINFTGGHFNYNNCERQTGLYATKRLLHHMGQLRYVSDDLWYRYSDKELRDMIVIATNNSKAYRDQNERLTCRVVGLLIVKVGLSLDQLKLVNFTGRSIEYEDRANWRTIQNGWASKWVVISTTPA